MLVTLYLDQVSSSQSRQKFWICHSASHSVASLVPERDHINEPSPIAEMKAVKNPVEIKGVNTLHIFIV